MCPLALTAETPKQDLFYIQSRHPNMNWFLVIASNTCQTNITAKEDYAVVSLYLVQWSLSTWCGGLSLPGVVVSLYLVRWSSLHLLQHAGQALQPTQHSLPGGTRWSSTSAVQHQLWGWPQLASLWQSSPTGFDPRLSPSSQTRVYVSEVSQPNIHETHTADRHALICDIHENNQVKGNWGIRTEQSDSDHSVFECWGNHV